MTAARVLPIVLAGQLAIAPVPAPKPDAARSWPAPIEVIAPALPSSMPAAERQQLAKAYRECFKSSTAAEFSRCMMLVDSWGAAK
jgi:hypothetical protein